MSIFVAIDHRNESIIKHLSNAPTEENLWDLRRSIAALAMCSNPDGVVVSHRDFVWAANQFGKDKVILGLPDISKWHDISAAILANVDSLPIRPVLIKIGFVVDDNENKTSELLVHLKEIVTTLGEDLNWVIEPYFKSSLGLVARQEFLSEASHLNQVTVFKLDLSDPKRFAKGYTTAANKPWVSRSDGMHFSEFCSRFTVAVRAGCVGAIVGAAIWSDLASQILQRDALEVATEKLTERISVLRNIINYGE